MRLWLALAVVVALGIPLLSAPTSASAATCGFSLGFKALHDLIPTTVGDCLVDEHHSGNGDSLQETTGPTGAGGLLVWRKADNWTAYTDGYHTWVNGPSGLQERLNTERFAWEEEPVAPVSAAVPAPLDSESISVCYKSASETVQLLQPHLISAAGIQELQRGFDAVKTGHTFTPNFGAFTVDLRPIQNRINQDCQNILRYGNVQAAQCFGWAWRSALADIYNRGPDYFLVDPEPIYQGYYQGCLG